MIQLTKIKGVVFKDSKSYLGSTTSSINCSSCAEIFLRTLQNILRTISIEINLRDVM